MPLAIGAVFARYRIVRLLGSGGMGEVYLAEHPRLPRQDALKVLFESMSNDPDYRERFNREADLAARLPIDQIARRAGVGAGTVYRHFPTKEALFQAVIENLMQRLVDDGYALLKSDWAW